MTQDPRTKRPGLDRRCFIATAGSGAASLVGASLLTRKGWARPPVEAASNAVTIRTHEYYGDIEEQLVFPGTWEVQVQRMKGHGRRGLTKAEIRKKLDQPIDTPSLREMAAGKKTAIITFDDLTRPTPARWRRPCHR